MTSLPKRFLILGSALAILLLAGGVYLLFGHGKFRGLEAFPSSNYLESPANLQGNRYILDAWIESQLVWREDVGRILEVRPNQDEGKLAVFVPADLPQNLHVGQRYRMDVRVRQGGFIHVQELEKY